MVDIDGVITFLLLQKNDCFRYANCQLGLTP